MRAFLFPGAIPQGEARNPRRFAVALAASAAAHLFLAAMLALDAPRSGAPQAMGPIHARLELDTGPAMARALSLPDSDAPHATRKDKQHAPVAGKRERPAPSVERTPPAQDATASLAVPHIPDPTYYSAGELDAYPRPTSPLGFDYPERAAHGSIGGRLLVQLLIDEHGTVREVSVVEAEPAGYFEDAARSVLAAARFLPGMKDGRAVKSRLLLSVSFAAAGDR